MARLDGERKNPLPWIIAAGLLILLGVGGYLLLQNRGADGVTPQNGNVSVVNNQPGGLLEGSANFSAPTANAIPEAGATQGSDATTSPSETPVGSETSVGGADTDGNSTPGTPDTNATGAPSGTNSASGGGGDGPDAKSSSASSSSGTTGQSTSGAAATKPAATQGPTLKRSKTITNLKTGTTTTYSKEVRPGGQALHSVTRTPDKASAPAGAHAIKP